MASTRREFLKAVGLGALGARLVVSSARSAPEVRPNIIFFLVDDMGWMDSTVYGSRYYETPSMERLARRSMRFTSAYAASPLCSPTRASILSGQYPARTGITTAVGHLAPHPAGTSLYPESAQAQRPLLYAESRRFLEPGVHTIAEVLQAVGYRTAHIGKWHLGLNPEHWPETQGFDVSFHGAPDAGPPRYHAPYGFAAGTVTDGPPGEYVTDRVTDEALAFMSVNRERPFLLHLWHYGVHGPWGHKEALTESFTGRVDPRGEQGNPIMASMLKSIDESLGRVLDAVDQLGIADRTVIIFFSDNGGNVHSRTEEDRRLSNVGPRHPQYAALQDYRRYAGFQPPTSNAPLRGGKSMLYEGGIRVPMMVAWPGVVVPGSTSDAQVCSVDFYPTLLAMAGAAPVSGTVLDGVDLTPVLRGDGVLPADRALFFYFPHGLGMTPPGIAVRRGQWKLIRWFETTAEHPELWELYNLEQDIGETVNLAARFPDLVRDLDRLATRHLAETGAALPKPNPAHDPASRLLTGWIIRNCQATLANGALRVQCGAGDAVLANATLADVAVAGPLTLVWRYRTARTGAGRVQWRTADQQLFPEAGQVAEFAVPAAADWHDLQVPLDITGSLVHFRLFPGIRDGVIEMAQVRILRPDGGEVRAWDFTGPP